MFFLFYETKHFFLIRVLSMISPIFRALRKRFQVIPLSVLTQPGKTLLKAVSKISICQRNPEQTGVSYHSMLVAGQWPETSSQKQKLVLSQWPAASSQKQHRVSDTLPSNRQIIPVDNFIIGLISQIFFNLAGPKPHDLAYI